MTEKLTLAKYEPGQYWHWNADDVSDYLAELNKLAGEMKFKVERPPHWFNLAVDIYDPVIGVMTVIRPRRRDVGVSQIVLNIDQVRAAVNAARAARIAKQRHLH